MMSAIENSSMIVSPPPDDPLPKQEQTNDATTNHTTTILEDIQSDLLQFEAGKEEPAPMSSAPPLLDDTSTDELLQQLDQAVEEEDSEATDDPQSIITIESSQYDTIQMIKTNENLDATSSTTLPTSSEEERSSPEEERPTNPMEQNKDEENNNIPPSSPPRTTQDENDDLRQENNDLRQEVQRLTLETQRQERQIQVLTSLPSTTNADPSDSVDNDDNKKQNNHHVQELSKIVATLQERIMVVIEEKLELQNQLDQVAHQKAAAASSSWFSPRGDSKELPKKEGTATSSSSPSWFSRGESKATSEEEKAKGEANSSTKSSWFSSIGDGIKAATSTDTEADKKQEVTGEDDGNDPSTASPSSSSDASLTVAMNRIQKEAFSTMPTLLEYKDPNNGIPLDEYSSSSEEEDEEREAVVVEDLYQDTAAVTTSPGKVTQIFRKGTSSTAAAMPQLSSLSSNMESSDLEVAPSTSAQPDDQKEKIKGTSSWDKFFGPGKKKKSSIPMDDELLTEDEFEDATILQSLEEPASMLDDAHQQPTTAKTGFV